MGTLILNVHEAPSITSGNKATFPTGLPGSFTVTTIGFPSVSARPLTQPLTPPTSPNQGKGMYFTVTGLPASLKASNLNPQGYATGTLTIQGTPSAGDAGTRRVQIMARNGVGATAQQTLMLDLVKLTDQSRLSGNRCNGAYTGVFAGDIGVSLGPELHVCRRRRKRQCHGYRWRFHTLQRKGNRKRPNPGIVRVFHQPRLRNRRRSDHRELRL